MRRVRTFIATPVVLPDEIRNIIKDFREGLKGEFIKWADLSQLHVTLRFLGDIDESLISIISGALEDAFSGIERGVVNFSGLGFFGSSGSPRVIWIGMEEYDIFSELKDLVDHAVHNLVSDDDNRLFKPHMTLGRIKNIRDIDEFHRILKAYGEEIESSLEISRVVFYKSELQKKGPIYSPLSTIILR